MLMIIGTLETCLLMQLKERNPPLALVKVMRLLTCSRTGKISRNFYAGKAGLLHLDAAYPGVPPFKSPQVFGGR